MAITLYGIKGNKYLLKENEEGVALNFTGKDAHRFKQVQRPRKPKQIVGFSLTVAQLYVLGLLPIDSISAEELLEVTAEVKRQAE